MSYSCFQTNVLAKFVDTMCIFLYTHSILCVIALNITIRASSSDIGGKYTRHHDAAVHTAKLSGCALKQGSKTHSSLRQSNLQRQNDAALRSCRIRAVEHRKCAAGLTDAHPGFQDCILLHYTRIENVHKVSYFCYV